jgi:hypothetical protein
MVATIAAPAYSTGNAGALAHEKLAQESLPMKAFP